MTGTRRPGDRVIRRRLSPRREIELPIGVTRPRVPHTRFHARIFVGIFVGVIIIGSALLALPWTTRSGNATPIPDALFTATSAASVTGLVTVDTYDHWNFLGQLVILLLIQIGGLGFMVGASIVLRILQRGARDSLRHALLIQDGAPAMTLQEAVILTRRTIRFTFIIEIFGAIALFIAYLFHGDASHIALWRGIFTAVSAFCNAGFDLQGNFQSLSEFNGALYFNIVLMMLIQAGALSYIVVADVLNNRSWRRLTTYSKVILITNGALIVIAFSVYLGAEWNGSMSNTPVIDRPLEALFQSVSVRTAGFSTVSFSNVSAFTDYVWIPIMGGGGASGSTAGGVKLGTVGVIAVAVVSLLRGHAEPEVFKRRLPISLLLRSMALVAIFLLVHFLTTAALAASEHFVGTDPAFITLLFESMSALATVGLSDGITTELTTWGKLILVFAMFVGRLGPLTLVYVLQTHQVEDRYRLPTTDFYIG